MNSDEKIITDKASRKLEYAFSKVIKNHLKS
jgi:hypothetical protein